MFGGGEGKGHGVALGRAGDVEGGVGEGVFGLGQADEFAGVVGGHGEGQGEGVGQAHILAGEDDKAAGEEAGVLATGEHLG